MTYYLSKKRYYRVVKMQNEINKKINKYNFIEIYY